VRNLRLVVLHPDSQINTYEVIDCADMSNEIKELIDLRIQTL